MLASRTPFTGGLYTRRDAAEMSSADLCTRIQGLQVVSVTAGGWTHLRLKSDKPLERESLDVLLPEYQYDFLFRPGRANRFLLVSSHDVNVTFFERTALMNQVSRPEIDISRLVQELATQPGKYSMGAVFARIEGQGQALRSSAFYGADLGESELFRRLLSEVNPFRVALRDVVKRTEIISIGSRGEIAFTYSSQVSLVDADSALRFLSDRGYLAWDTEETPHEHRQAHI